jgi:NADPH:quinone reductase-like Zn-dependent oxidoreductase
MGLVGGGAFAERVCVPATTVLPVPERFSWDQAAAIPEAFLTALDALVLQAGLKARQSVLVHAAASGVGTAATQLAAAFGAWVAGSVRSVDKVSSIQRLGVSLPLVVQEDPPRFASMLREATQGAGMDVAVDLVGGNYFPETLAAMGAQGRVILLGLLGGANARVDLGKVLQGRLQVFGSTMRHRSLEERTALADQAKTHLLPLLATGRVGPVVHAVHPFERVQEAVRSMSENRTVGKVVLSWEGPAVSGVI